MRLAIINTGGTMSCVGTPLAPMTSAAFAEASRIFLDPLVAQELSGVELEYVTDLVFPATGLGTLDSTNLQPSDWCIVAERILTDYQLYDGWVIIHGTDSMAHSASALPFLLNAFDRSGAPTATLSKPVILTGSQSPLYSQDSPADPLALRYMTDAFQNMCAAIAFAARGIPEVAVAFRGKLLRGTRVLKVNADRDDAFSSPSFPPLGVAGIDIQVDTSLLLPGPIGPDVSLDNPRVQERMIDRIHHIASHIDHAAVVPFRAFPAAFDASGALIAELLCAVLTVGVRGLILESYGAGNFPSGTVGDSEGAVERTIAQATAEGITVVNCTQVLSGTVDSSIYAAGAWLASAGAVSPGDMTPICAFSKLTVLLAESDWPGNDWGPQTARDLIGQSLLGERTVPDRLETSGARRLMAGQSLSTPDQSANLGVSVDGQILLTAADGDLLWSVAPEDPARANLPLHLMIDARGVSAVDRTGQAVWSAGVTGNIEVASLAVRGSTVDRSLSVDLLDGHGNVVARMYGLGE